MFTVKETGFLVFPLFSPLCWGAGTVVLLKSLSNKWDKHYKKYVVMTLPIFHFEEVTNSNTTLTLPHAVFIITLEYWESKPVSCALCVQCLWIFLGLSSYDSLCNYALFFMVAGSIQWLRVLPSFSLLHWSCRISSSLWVTCH
jgi:hypothetical protein